MEIVVKQEDLLAVEVDAITYPGTSAGTMGDALGRRLVELAGEEILTELQDRAPIAVGAATALDVAGLKAPHLIYVPVVMVAGDKMTVENIRRCTRASVVAACHLGYHSLALPALLPNSEDMSVTETARAMVDELRGYKTDPAFVVLLTDPQPQVVDVLLRSVESVR